MEHVHLMLSSGFTCVSVEPIPPSSDGQSNGASFQSHEDYGIPHWAKPFLCGESSGTWHLKKTTLSRRLLSLEFRVIANDGHYANSSFTVRINPRSLNFATIARKRRSGESTKSRNHHRPPRRMSARIAL
jgi:hypothetical protein